MHEPIVLKKLDFSEKFLIYALYLRKTALRIRLLKLSIIIAILLLKLHIRYRRLETEVTGMIKIIEEILQL